MEKPNCTSIVLLMANILWLLLSVTAQPGFLNINCGASSSYNDSQTNLTWTTDANYIDLGQPANVSNSTVPYFLQSLRFFPKPLNKSCYILPVNPNITYLIRLWFLYGNYNGNQQLPSFNISLEMPSMLYQKTQSFTSGETPTWTSERIFMASSTVLYVCLIRNSQFSDPFISGIELRALSTGMYESNIRIGTMLTSLSRYNMGADSSDLVRYPQDEFDRFWLSDMSLNLYDNTFVKKGRSNKPVPQTLNNITNFPPAIVMQTAVIVLTIVNRLRFDLVTQDSQTLIVLYFAEVEALNPSMSRNFNVFINDQTVANIDFPKQNYSIEVPVTYNDTQLPSVVVSLESLETNDTYGRGPLINALEYYKIAHSEAETLASDVSALLFIKSSFDIKDWISDPCYAIEWEGIRCNQSSPVRVWELDLSGRGLYGYVPSRINELTELRSISLHDNHLTGSLPDLCGLIKLEILSLQNNNLSGNIPDCFSELNNLRELNIENNNFSGSIPEKLLSNTVLKFSYLGNPHLCINKDGCKNNNNKKKKLGIVLGSVIGIIFAVSLALIIVCQKRLFNKKGTGLSVNVPNPIQSRSFSPEEMKIATHNFSQQIGHGGFGIVYFGNLVDGREVAVKVLSASSKQGVAEFLNEIDLLSRANHKNLVSLIGYCNDSKQLMLVYEHMRGGSLKDHLYGTMANSKKLDWKARVRVALDAAEGLEYLHVSCSPKIIHRDVKSSNILVDSNMRAKVSDFGLSRIIGDDMESHVTTTVKGTVGYLDPEYFDTNKLTERSDVYSFGVVLLEIICGRKPIDENLLDEQLNIVKWVKVHLQSKRNSDRQLQDIIDTRLQMSEYDMESFYLLVDLSMRCIENDGSKRPTISQIVNSLKEAMVMIDLEDSSKQLAESSAAADSSCSILQVGR